MIPEIQGDGGSGNDRNVAHSSSNIEFNGLINIPIMSYNSQENIVEKDRTIESSVQHAVIDGSGRGGSSNEEQANNLSFVVSVHN